MELRFIGLAVRSSVSAAAAAAIDRRLSASPDYLFALSNLEQSINTF
jgi:hypothetical protein